MKIKAGTWNLLTAQEKRFVLEAVSYYRSHANLKKTS
ncbi:hypothetical protein SAMN05443252_10439 [Bacillus sp. OV322]|nr:hypothetical protein SAMN05443252_10439 [Bacillus sp. OV322]